MENALFPLEKNAAKQMCSEGNVLLPSNNATARPFRLHKKIKNDLDALIGFRRSRNSFKNPWKYLSLIAWGRTKEEARAEKEELEKYEAIQREIKEREQEDKK